MARTAFSNDRYTVPVMTMALNFLADLIIIIIFRIYIAHINMLKYDQMRITILILVL